jgi:hypothetical protein
MLGGGGRSEVGRTRYANELEAKNMDPHINKGVPAFSGLKYFRSLKEGCLARPSMFELFDTKIEVAEPNVIVLNAVPTAEYYNPYGFIHGGYTFSLLAALLTVGGLSGRSFSAVCC